VGEALHGLTTRGMCFLGAGIAAALCALVFRENDLLRIAGFLCVLPLLSAAAVARTRYRLACIRSLEPTRVQVGTPTKVVLRLENVSRLPSGLMLLEDQVPYALGSRPRFVLNRLRPGQTSTVTYSVRADLRGRYRMGPLTVRLSDPFGLCEVSRSFAAVDELVVTPVIHRLPGVHMSGEWIGAGESQARSVAVHGQDDASIREYRQGDDLRKVHWRSTARAGELMVRREEQPWQSRATVVLDTRAIAHRGDGLGSSFEWAVSAAASIAVTLGRHGYLVRVVTDAGTDIDAAAVGGADAMLEYLAEVKPSRFAGLGRAAQLMLPGGGEGLVIGVLGELSPGDRGDLARLRNGGSACVALLLDLESWGPAPHGRWHPGQGPQAAPLSHHGHRDAARELTGTGWRVLDASHGTRLVDLWPQAGHGSVLQSEGASSEPIQSAPVGMELPR
jgi:uncharacterized protein (DUF58 family)